MKTIIISDTHLKFYENEEDRLRRKKVAEFLISLKNKTDLLIINGDFFDLWVTWKHLVIREYFPIINILYELIRSGTHIVMIPGNHDFWFNNFLSDQIGIEICKNSYIKTIEGRSFFIDHGDRFTANDIRYQIFRFIIRNPVVQKLFSCFHPDLALEIGIKLSRSSRKRKIPEKKRERMVKGLRNAAEKLINKFHYDYVIFGHSHIPAIENFNEAVYANSGDWITHSSYLEFSDKKLELKEYKGDI